MPLCVSLCNGFYLAELQELEVHHPPNHVTPVFSFSYVI